MSVGITGERSPNILQFSGERMQIKQPISVIPLEIAGCTQTFPYHVVKRTIDILVPTISLVVISPMLVLIAIIIEVSSR
jgi:lipopolysaccharide/colanic/teichoic acid biosynthesis glycosyltransferase